MKNSLQFRLIIAFTLVILLTVGAVFLMMWQATVDQVRQFGHRIDFEIGGRINFEISRYYSQQGSWDGVQSLVVELSDQFRHRIVLTDVDGKIIADSSQDSSDVQLTPDKFIKRAGHLSVRIFGAGFHAVFDIAARVTHRMAPRFTVAGVCRDRGRAPHPRPSHPHPADQASTVVGYLYLAPTAQSEISLAALQFMYNEIGRYFILGAILAVIVAIMLTIVISRPILAPIKALTLAAQKLGRGDFSQRVKIADKSEIGELASTFNLMAHDLQRDEQLRRDTGSGYSSRAQEPAHQYTGIPGSHTG